MRASWILCGALLVLAFAGAMAAPGNGEVKEGEQESTSGWKTYHAIKHFFSPVTNYFRGLPEKTPTDVATDVKDKVTDVKEWAAENDAIQALLSSLVPVKNWLQEKADVLQDKTFKEMYDDVKSRVVTLDDRIASWIAERDAKKLQ